VSPSPHSLSKGERKSFPHPFLGAKRAAGVRKLIAESPVGKEERAGELSNVSWEDNLFLGMKVRNLCKERS